MGRMYEELRKTFVDDVERENIKPKKGDILQHKKGMYYIVLELGDHSETQQPMVIYRSIDTKKVWVRPLEMFTADRFKVLFNMNNLYPQ